ncbi:maleylacetoacetate isomerase [Asticcacaulis biprosthecium C19]|uniref:Maleylacetoacetate isomerase n=1 Tax=Asticcacaulis biprosthecium C19 TaxID=715226 RepID=F4QNR6_9CAUL|nr:maleylacetoacetate isomerase [Asticcacaulis biprosthecium]EGF90974.1 maleylacetoacetate isomerase [Asticcacaulis biprosthecium C19]
MLKLHGYWRSSAAYRVRIALNLKNLPYEQVSHDLRTGEQHSAAYKALNPQGLVPALEHDGEVITQSQAILEWLDERFPEPALLPATPEARAAVRAMCGLVACDIHPLNNLRVLKALKTDLMADENAIKRWTKGWIGEGFAALDQLIAHHGHGYCFGNAPTLADCLLIPQIFSAQRFEVDLKPYPNIRAVGEHCADHPAFNRAHPRHQPDADTVDAQV